MMIQSNSTWRATYLSTFYARAFPLDLNIRDSERSPPHSIHERCIPILSERQTFPCETVFLSILTFEIIICFTNEIL